MLNVSVLSVAFAVAGGAAAAVLLPWYAVPLTVWSGTALAWLAYRAAVRAASGYAALVRAAFDVHRWKLLDEMGLRRPTGYAEERAQWAQLRKLWREMGPDSDGAHLLRYPTEDPPAAATSDAPDPAPADLTPAEPASALPSAWAVHGPAPAATSTPPQAKADITPPATTPAPPATASATPAPAETADTPARPDETARPTRAATARRWARTLLLGRRNPARLPVDIARLVLLAGIAAAIPTALIGLVADSPQAARELPAYHQLTAADVRGEAASLAERYTLRPFREGETIDPTFLGPKLDRSALAGRVITTVTAEAGGAAVARKGGRVTLLAPAKGGSFIVVGEVVVLDLLPSDRVVIAVAKADLPRLASGAAGPVRLLADAK